MRCAGAAGEPSGDQRPARLPVPEPAIELELKSAVDIDLPCRRTIPPTDVVKKRPVVRIRIRAGMTHFSHRGGLEVQGGEHGVAPAVVRSPRPGQEGRRHAHQDGAEHLVGVRLLGLGAKRTSTGWPASGSYSTGIFGGVT